MKAIPERGPVDADYFEREVATIFEPVVLRGQVAAWPAVAAAHEGHAAIAAYINQFDNRSPADVLVGPAQIGGRFFYNDAVNGFNFERGQVPLRDLLEELLRNIERADAPALYAGAATTDAYLPGWELENQLALPVSAAKAKIWVGNRSRIAPHFDASRNIACVVAGRRRFTVFPPDQIDNLYIGPLEFTMAGQPASMVDCDAPDFARYPKFATALDHAMSAELEPGDAIFIPALWWHGVSALSPLNVLVNYWWGEADDRSPFAALVHALLSLRDVDLDERKAWRHWFDHYAFGDDATSVGSHLPPHARGVLAPSSVQRTEQIKAYLMRALSRSSH